MSATKTFRGRELDELLAQIKAELGPDAVIVAQREDVEGGVGGFFAKRVIEVDAAPGGAMTAGRRLLDVVADEPAMPAFDDEPEGPYSPFSSPAPPAAASAAPAEPTPLAAPEDATAEPTFEAHLKALLGQAADVAPPAPAVRPVIVPSVDDAPTPEPVDVAEVARAFSQAPVVEDEPVEQVPAPEPVEPPVAEVLDAEVPAAAPPVVEAAAPVEPEPVVEAQAPAPAPAATTVATTTPATPARTASTDVLAPLVPTPVTDRDSAWEALVEAGVGATLAADIVEETVTHLLPFASEPTLKPLVQRALAGRIPIHATRGAAGRVIGFVGPGGSGKTHCAARLAAAYSSRTTTPVACVTLRPKDGGAQLRDLLTGSGVEVHAENDVESAVARVERLRATSMVVLDTPAVSPKAEAELRVLATELAQLRADEVHLTMPATIAPRPARELLAGTRALGTCAIAITHTDETDAIGTVVDAAIASGTPLSFLGRGQSVKTGLAPADAHDLATTLLP